MSISELNRTITGQEPSRTLTMIKLKKIHPNLVFGKRSVAFNYLPPKIKNFPSFLSKKFESLFRDFTRLEIEHNLK